MTHWDPEENFHAWVSSPEFYEGHKRMAQFKDENGKMALPSSIKTYHVCAR